MAPVYRIPVAVGALILLLSLTGAGCGPDGDGPGGDATVSGADANPDDDGAVTTDGGHLQNCDLGPPPVLGRGLTWVRNNPMFITGLTVAVDAPSADRVDEYFDDFAANAVHLWEDGLPTQMDGWAAAGRADFRFLSWVRGDGTSHDGGLLLGGYGANPFGRIGYQISDEPRTMAQLTALEVGITATRAVDPEALIVVNFSLSSEGLPEMLDYYADHMDGDVVAFDTYVYSNAVYERYGLFREAGLASDRPYWCYLNSYVDAGEPIRPTESDMRWNALLALTYGYTGVTWFLYQIGPPHSQDLDPILFVSSGDLTAEKTEQYQYAAQLNRELRQLGRAITQLTSTDVRYISSLENVHPLGIEDWTRGAGCDRWITAFLGPSSEPEDLLLGFFVDDDGERYVMIQNAHHTMGVFPANNADPVSLRVTFDFFDQTDPDFATDSVLHLDKITGQVVQAPLTDLGQSRAELQITLAAGDTYLFKYNTGRPFALQPAP